MFVAIITRIRYFGGGFGCMPSARRTTRLKKPRGLFRPEISESSDCSVPMPPPPSIPPIIIRERRDAAVSASGASKPASAARSAAPTAVGSR